MQDIKIWEQKIQEKRKNTPWREYVKEISSRTPLVFYKRNGLISKYSVIDRIGKIIPNKEYQAQKDSFTDMGIEYDFGLIFFENLKKLFLVMPFAHMRNEVSENSEFADVIVNSKNAYLSSTVINGSENVLYSFSVKDNSKNINNSVMVRDNSENIYFCTGIVNSFSIFYSKFIINSSNIWFSTNLIGCHDCMFCNDLDSKSYCIKNEQYNKEEYIQRRQEILRDKKKFLNNYKNLYKKGNNFGSTNVEGNMIFNSENIKNSNLCYNVKDGNNLILVGSREGAEHMYDCFTGGSPYGLDFYGVNGAGAAQNLYNVRAIDSGSSNIYYSCDIISCSYCLGCIGLKNKEFCILNKQYTKEERFELANKIFQQMESDGILGNFFPGWMNPFYFNDTAAYLIDDSFTREEIEKDGYSRRNEEIKIDAPTGTDIIETKDLDNYQGYDTNGNWIINPEILKKIIKDDKGNYYKIVPMELEFLQKYGLPLPEIHWLDRIKLGFKFK